MAYLTIKITALLLLLMHVTTIQHSRKKQYSTKKQK